MKKGSDNRSKQSGKQGIRGDKEKKERGEINMRERREIKKREKETKMENFQAFRRSKFDSPRRKVNPLIASYVWVSKSWSFVKLHEVGNFSTLNIFSLKTM